MHLHFYREWERERKRERERERERIIIPRVTYLYKGMAELIACVYIYI